MINISPNDKVLTLQQIIQYIIDYGYNMKLVTSYSEWLRILEKNSGNNPLESLLSFFIYGFPGEPVPVNFYYKVIKNLIKIDNY